MITDRNYTQGYCSAESNVKIFLKCLALTVMAIWGCQLFQHRKLPLKNKIHLVVNRVCTENFPKRNGCVFNVEQSSNANY